MVFYVFGEEEEDAIFAGKLWLPLSTDKAIKPILP